MRNIVMRKLVKKELKLTKKLENGGNAKKANLFGILFEIPK